MIDVEQELVDRWFVVAENPAMRLKGHSFGDGLEFRYSFVGKC